MANEVTQEQKVGIRRNAAIASHSGSGANIVRTVSSSYGALIVSHGAGGVTPSQAAQGIGANGARSGQLSYRNQS